MDDTQIIEMYFNRDENAIRETESKYGKYCYGIAYNVLRNNEDAYEAVNDTYFGVWNSIPPNTPKILSAFIGRITRNICLNKLRSIFTLKRGQGETQLVYDEISEITGNTGQDVEDEIEAKELSIIINQFLYSLTETERNIFIRRYWYFDNIADISKRFRFSKSKVKSMLFRIRKKLRVKLTEEGYI